MTTYRTVIDCDTGIDDALALLAAVGSSALEIEFVTTVAGNAAVEQTIENTLRVLALAGRPEIPVYQGAARPLSRDLVTGAATHGAGGLVGPDLPASPARAAGDAGDVLGRWCRERSEEPKTLIAIGPLTNLGRLLAADRSAMAGVDQLFVMGGSISGRGGALSPRAETNFFIDPEAARLVVRSGLPIRLYDYDATTACQISPEQIAEVSAAIPAEIAPFVNAWFAHLLRTSRERFGRQGVPVHDLYAVAGATSVGPGRWERYTLDVGLDEGERGVVRATPARDGPGVDVARDLHPAAMAEYFIEAVSALR